jgi:hypothetical protein
MVVLCVCSPVVAADLIERAEATPWPQGDGTTAPRVQRDEEGHVTRLVLDDMPLAAEEFAAIGKLEHLRRLSLNRTNCQDRDLKPLAGMRLEGLILNHTDITDDGIDALLELKQLKSVCLGNVRITPEGVARLKGATRARGQTLGIGYSQRKP